MLRTRPKSVFHLEDYVFTAKWSIQLVFEVVINSCADIKQSHFSFIGKYILYCRTICTYIHIHYTVYLVKLLYLRFHDMPLVLDEINTNNSIVNLTITNFYVIKTKRSGLVAN